MATDIFIAKTDTDIESCFPVFHALRPHIQKQDFLPQIRRQQAQSYQILALKHDMVIKSVAGFRFAEFLAWGKVLYIDDLSTLPDARSKGFAGSCWIGWSGTHEKTIARRCTWIPDTHNMRHIGSISIRACSLIATI